MEQQNRVEITMESRSVNEQFARMAVAAFIAPLDPSVSELTDIKTAVSEAVTNAIIHGYEHTPGEVRLSLSCEGRCLTVEVSDDGAGIENIPDAMQPLFTTKPELERSGMGFTVMENFMDEVRVISEKGKGTAVVMKRKLS
ncbi:MAG: anti-sigma F factor [Clostridiales bacterium]|jgi:stage II sporulation protein AB (anti-sigma F factor)|nr:anti-sigma F factor [Clostridiales bacterium]